MTTSPLKKYLGFLLIGALLLPQSAFAQQNTLLPEVDNCTNYDGKYYDNTYFKSLEIPPANGEAASSGTRNGFLGCAIKKGEIHLWMLPYFISYFANFFIGIAGVVSLLFVLLGGFWYMTGGVTDDKEKGKKTITYALMGMVLTLLAWIIVNVVQVQVTQ